MLRCYRNIRRDLSEVRKMNTMAVKGKNTAPQVSPEEAYEIGVVAYIFWYPLIVMDIARRRFISSGGQMNVFQHSTTYPDINSRSSVLENLDMLDSNAWLDLTAEPMILSLGDTGGRYYSMPMLDMWTNVFAAPGWRTTGTLDQNYAIVPPGWRGTLPSGIDAIQAPTPYVWIRGHTRCNSPQITHKSTKSCKASRSPLSPHGEENPGL